MRPMKREVGDGIAKRGRSLISTIALLHFWSLCIMCMLPHLSILF